MKKNNKGFTLAEMLIVVAIIGILIAILVPAFAAQLNKAKVAKNEANIRSAISEVTSNGLLGDGDTTKTIDIDTPISGEIGGVNVNLSAGKVTVTWNGEDATTPVTVTNSTSGSASTTTSS